jgi:threonyl-tRNA synthetase
MKILTLHCDYIKFKPVKKAIKNPENITSDKEVEVREPLVVLTAVEKGDDETILNQMVSAVKKTAGEVKAKNIVLYPYAHLSANLSLPEHALEILQKAENLLSKDKSLSVSRAPFGYYKEFELKCKGHPLSELSKSFGAVVNAVESAVSPILKKEEIYDPAKILREISRSKLDTSKLKENDHRIIGMKQDLFSFNEAAPGMVFWHDKGLTIFNELVAYWREEHKKAGYQEISTPQVMDRKLWEISGHWKLYKDNMFTTSYEGREFAVKPMNCPGGMLVYRSTPKSYKDLPLRAGELGKVHRLELSGTLAGLFRVIQFTQDDAHIFCTEEQLESEIIGVIEMFKKMLGKFGFKDYKFTLSTRSEEKKDKYLGTDSLWKSAEDALANGLKNLKIKFEKVPGEAKFYGPSLDVLIKDSLGREWQCSTLQLDFNIPQRYEASYTDKDNTQKTPIMLHRVVYGSLERFIGVLLEHLNGALPLWLSPVQARVISFTDRNEKAAQKIVDELKKELPQLRVDSDFTSTTVNDKIRNAEIHRIPYIIVIGDKEEAAKTLAVRKRGEPKPKFGVKASDLVKELKDKIETRALD